MTRTRAPVSSAAIAISQSLCYTPHSKMGDRTTNIGCMSGWCAGTTEDRSNQRATSEATNRRTCGI